MKEEMNQTVFNLKDKNIIEYENYIPISILIDDFYYSVINWEEVYTTTLDYLYSKWKYSLIKHENERLRFDGIDDIVLANSFHKYYLRKGLPVGKKLFAEADFPTVCLIRILRFFSAECNPSFNPSIICVNKDTVETRSNKPLNNKENTQNEICDNKAILTRPEGLGGEGESKDIEAQKTSVKLSPLGEYIKRNCSFERKDQGTPPIRNSKSKTKNTLYVADKYSVKKLLIEFQDIRKDRLGVVNSSIYPGLKKLVAEIYPEEAHFIYELLQNAEDAQATKVRFEINPDKLVFSHNGTRLFSLQDIDSITNIAKSTKSDNYIQAGKFGIGFKSVYVFTDTPYIYCDSVCFKIEKLLLPTVIPDLPKRERGWTVFHFPFKESKTDSEEVLELIKNSFRELKPSTLMFLNSIYSVEYSYDSNRYKLESFRNENLVIITLSDNENNVIQTNAALKFSRVSTLNGKAIYVDIAFPIKQKNDMTDWSFVKGDDKVFITFLANNERSHLKFYINAPFGCTPSRDTINKFDHDNQKLIEELCILIKDSLSSLHKSHLLRDDFLELLPVSTEAVPEFYQPIVRTIYKEFQNNKYLLSLDGKYIQPADAIIQSKNLEKAVTIDDVRSLWNNKKLQFIRSRAKHLSAYRFLEEIGIREITSRNLLNRIGNIGNNTLRGFIKSKSDSALMSLYIYLYKGMEEFITEYDKYVSYKNKAVARPWRYKDKELIELYDDYCKQRKVFEKLELIRDINGEIVSSENTYFLEDNVEMPEEFHIVKPNVYEDPVAKKFLILLGVKSFTKKEVAEYSYNNEINQIKRTLERVTRDTCPLELSRKILAFLEKHPETEVDFSKYHYVKAFDSLTKSYRYMNAGKCYLDEPFVSSNGFRQLVRVHRKLEISEEYLDLKEVELEKWIAFLKRQKIYWTIEVRRQECNNKYKSGRDIDYYVENLESYIHCQIYDFNLFLWNYFTQGDNWVKDVYKYHYTKRTSREEEALTASSLLCVLRDNAWIPDKEGKFYRPSEITRNDIDICFVVDERNGFLADIEFEKQARERKEQERLQKEKERMQQEENLRVLHALGFENTEDVWAAKKSAQLFAELMSLGIDPKKLLEKTKNRNKAEELSKKEEILNQDNVKRNEIDSHQTTSSENDDLPLIAPAEPQKNQSESKRNASAEQSRNSLTSDQADIRAIDDFLEDIIQETDGSAETIPATGDSERRTKQSKISRQRKKVVRDILEQTYRQTDDSPNNHIDFINKVDEADHDEFLPTLVDYHKKIEQAKLKSARDIERIVHIEELQQTACEAKKYTYLWFKTLLEMESLNAADANANSREVSISFLKVEREIGTERTLVLKNPNQYIPHFMEDLADIPLVLHIGEQRKVLPIEVVNIKSYTLRVKIKKGTELDDVDLNAVSQATIDAKSPAFLLEELRNRFNELGYADDFNMMENLPENIEFIFGPPGTGKTTYIAKNVLRPMMESQTPYKVLVLTPTNKSADVLVRRLMESFGEDTSYEKWLVRFGTTGEEMIESSSVFRDKTFDIRTLEKCVTVTTIARFPYDFFMPDINRIFLNGYNWDYIVIDEASMIPVANIVYPLFKKTPTKFIIAGDPFQIEPITSIDLWKNENIYTMVKLDSFANPVTRPYQYKVECLTTQYRSVPDIGYLFSNFAYGGILKHYRSSDSQRKLNINPGLGIKTVNIIKFPVSKYESIYRAKRLNHSSSYQIYSALFTYEYASFLSKEISRYNPKENFKIGIIAPYRAQADMIDKLLASDRLPRGVDIQVGTIHGFQGDECDVIFVVLNTPPYISASNDMFLNKRNIINVSISRARDYLFVIMPDDETENVANLRLVNYVEDLIKKTSSWNEFHSSELERLMFDDDHYLENNAFSTSHQRVNVYGLPEKRYEVRTEEDAVDIQVHKGSRFY